MLRMCFSSPETKAQMSFSDQNLSVIRRFHRSGRCSRKLCRGFKKIQMKGYALFQGEIIAK